MSFESPLLNAVNSVHEVPSGAYILYNLDGGIFWVDANQYSDFVLQWIGTTKPPPLTMDLSSAGAHSIILDFDFKKKVFPEGYAKYVLAMIQSLLKMVFLPLVPHFTYIIAMRKGSKGIHIHLPEFLIGHEDYEMFCQFLQSEFKQYTKNEDVYELDILSNAMLTGASKVKDRPYTPSGIVYVDQDTSCFVSFFNSEEGIESKKKTFKKKKQNAESLFRHVLFNCNLNLIMSQIKQFMMPVVANRQPVYSVSYPSVIGKCSFNSPKWVDVARFTYKKCTESGFISKSTILQLDSLNVLKIYHYLKLNARNMKEFETKNHALKMWFTRCGHPHGNQQEETHIPKMFRDVHETLQYEHTTLANDPNPIGTIMQFNDGYYFLPVFYALCQIFKQSSFDMAQHLHELLDPSFHTLLDKIRAINPENLEYAMMDISMNTLHFCANNLCTEQPRNYREKLKRIVENNKRAILSVTSNDQIADLIRSIQDRHLPIRVLKLKNALKKPNRYVWNALSESWQEIHLSSEVSDHIYNLWNSIKTFINEYRTSGGLGGPDEEMINKFSIAAVVSAIMSDTSMERKNVQMDDHKWFLRLNNGVLDLLTGHIGGVVPEFFLSDRKINVEISRAEMIRLCNDSPKHVKLYRTLTDMTFFLKYLQDLFLDVTDNLYDTLRNRVDLEEVDDVSKSMMHFYINLCKCTSFEYDMLVYMLDVLASVYVGTNYERKFFVLKGLTRNGKSKLFELMGRMLGGYYHSIQSENLSPGHSANNATPELASTIFSCRMVTSEELEKKIDENRVKQITGNSFVAFRNLYEPTSGGIPTAKLFVTTNNYPECKASEAFKDRVVAIPFEAEFTDMAPKPTSDQVGTNTYRKEVYVVEQSYRGCFFVLYYHLKEHMNLKDGLLHYRAEPDCVVEYTNDYLIHADIYVQFKMHMDIQMIPGTMTTMNDLKSAVRQYLKTTKNTAFHESDLIVSFEKEFGGLRRTDVQLEHFGYRSVMDEELGEPASKKAKTNDDSTVVYYEGVVIKNLKKSNADL